MARKLSGSENLFYVGLLGLAAADAVGVPYEFKSRSMMDKNPAEDMTGYGTHNQPVGTWSDDTSMTLCLAESLRSGFSPEKMLSLFALWVKEAEFTATDTVFDIGITCKRAIFKYLSGESAPMCGGRNASDNGNGSLMRTFPVSLWAIIMQHISQLTDTEMVTFVHVASATTHAHERSLVACGIYTFFLKEWILGGADDTPYHALERAYVRAEATYRSLGDYFAREIDNTELFLRPDRLLSTDRSEIRSGGYVADTLNAALYCLLTTGSYRDCVLKAVNLGDDTDTTAAVAGSLAAIVYGEDNIPEAWREKLLKKDLIASVSETALSAVDIEESGLLLKPLAQSLHNQWFTYE